MKRPSSGFGKEAERDSVTLPIKMKRPCSGVGKEAERNSVTQPIKMKTEWKRNELFFLELFRFCFLSELLIEILRYFLSNIGAACGFDQVLSSLGVIEFWKLYVKDAAGKALEDILEFVSTQIIDRTWRCECSDIRYSCYDFLMSRGAFLLCAFRWNRWIS